MILFLTHRDGSLYSGGILVLGIILAALGVWIIASPQLVAVLVPRVIGALICIHGIGDLGDAIALRRADHPRWTAALILGLVTLVLGAVLVDVYKRQPYSPARGGSDSGPAPFRMGETPDSMESFPAPGDRKIALPYLWERFDSDSE